ncbi:MAG TPA: hypothetical protein VEY50_07425 [Lysobacter sp.]|nr:hypothetical protein [Lysobacter sp.]
MTDSHDFDAAMRAAHREALQQLHPETRHALRVAARAAPLTATVPRARGWAYAGGLATAALAIALAVSLRGVPQPGADARTASAPATRVGAPTSEMATGDAPAATAPSLAADTPPDADDPALAVLDDPEFFLWLAEDAAIASDS